MSGSEKANPDLQTIIRQWLKTGSPSGAETEPGSGERSSEQGQKAQAERLSKDAYFSMMRTFQAVSSAMSEPPVLDALFRSANILPDIVSTFVITGLKGYFALHQQVIEDDPSALIDPRPATTRLGCADDQPLEADVAQAAQHRGVRFLRARDADQHGCPSRLGAEGDVAHARHRLPRGVRTGGACAGRRRLGAFGYRGAFPQLAGQLRHDRYADDAVRLRHAEQAGRNPPEGPVDPGRERLCRHRAELFDAEPIGRPTTCCSRPSGAARIPACALMGSIQGCWMRAVRRF